MGIYYYAVDENAKKQIWAPENFADKIPGIFHPNNPFPGMVIMKNIEGYDFKIFNDYQHYHDKDEYEDITEQVYEEYKSYFDD